MSKPVYGTCPTCKRAYILLTSRNGDCHRCWRRKKQGQDPLGVVQRGGSKKGAKRSAKKNDGDDLCNSPAPLAELSGMSNTMTETLKALESDLSNKDPRVTFECQHCGLVLSSAEVEEPNCPSCDGRLHTHLTRSGEVFTVSDIKPSGEFVSQSVAEQVCGTLCDNCGVCPCICFEQGAFLQHDFGKVTNAEGDAASFGTDLVVIMALDEAWAVKRGEWLVELSGLSPIKTLSRAVQMVDAIKGVGY